MTSKAGFFVKLPIEVKTVKARSFVKNKVTIAIFEFLYSDIRINSKGPAEV